MGSIIDPGSAKSLIQEYQQQNSAPGGSAITTPEGNFLNGYFVDRESLEAILSNHAAVGVSVYLAKHPDFAGTASHPFTLVYAAAEPNTDPGAPTPYVITRDLYGDPPPFLPHSVTLLYPPPLCTLQSI